MQLAKFEVRGLFDQLSHEIAFAPPREARPGPSLAILHGPNGIGKTTILKMIDGLMRLDFNQFRRVPFTECSLHFSTDDSISVRAKRNDVLQSLLVKYNEFEAELHPRRPGPIDMDDEEQRNAVEKFRRAFFSATDSLDFELIETTRILGTLDQWDDEDRGYLGAPPYAFTREQRERYMLLHAREQNPKARTSEHTKDLAEEVRRFVREAQVNYRRFFTTTEPDLFPKILHRLADSKPEDVRAEELLKRLRTIRKEDQQARELGLEPEQWDYQELASFLEERKGSPEAIDHALTVLSAYVETLESRAAERQLVAERLRNFEGLVSDFFENKRLVIHPRNGFKIETDQGKELSQDQLSSGEYHLLYLMVSALVTQRRGTVIAIDEPEMSMHLKWQRRLISALMECASKAEPQFIFATHSPDIAADYPDDMVNLHLPS